MIQLQLPDRTLSVELLNLTDLLCLPKAKEPRLVGDWAEADGKEYDLSEPIYLDAKETSLRFILLSATEGDLRALASSEFIKLEVVSGRTVSIRPISVGRVDKWLTKARWAGSAVFVELSISSDTLLDLFGDGMPKDITFSDAELAGRGIRVAPDWSVLRLPPSPKVALDRSSKTSFGKEVYNAVGRKERAVQMTVWIDAQNAIESYLQFASQLRSNVAGHWVISGSDYYLRYQSMSIIDYLPSTTRPLLSLRLELQQYRYE